MNNALGNCQFCRMYPCGCPESDWIDKEIQFESRKATAKISVDLKKRNTKIIKRWVFGAYLLGLFCGILISGILTLKP